MAIEPEAFAKAFDAARPGGAVYWSEVEPDVVEGVFGAMRKLGLVDPGEFIEELERLGLICFHLWFPYRAEKVNGEIAIVEWICAKCKATTDKLP